MKSATARALMSNSDIQDKTICAEIRFSVVGTRRKVSSSAIETDADKTLVHVGKDILDSKTLCAIRNLDQNLRLALRRIAMQSRVLHGGVYIVPIGVIERVDAMVEEAQRERAKLVDEFLADYPRLVADAQQRLGSLYDPADYPSAEIVRNAFKLTLNYTTFTVPDALKGISGALFEREREKTERMWREAEEEIRDALRVSFRSMVAHLSDKLTTSEDGSKKKLHESSVKKFSEFLELFEARNICDDAQLKALVDRARKVMDGVTINELRSDEDTRESIAASFAAIESNVDRMLVKGGRRITFE